MAFSGDRIEEVALDWFAQDDQGGVWYFGEDVADYDETGTIYTNEGTWLVGGDNKLAMNFPPSAPAVGDVWLAEDAYPEAWEQITVIQVDQTRDGPSGPIEGVVEANELKTNGDIELKVFARGYGEFTTGSAADDNLEALALAIPTDALNEAKPAELDTLSSGLADVFASAETEDWTAAAASLSVAETAWAALTIAAVQPPLLEAEMDRVLADLDTSVAAQDAHQARNDAIQVARVAYDLRLRFDRIVDIDAVRLDLWLAQVAVDAEVGDSGSARGDAAVADLIWKRFRHTIEASLAAEIERQLGDLVTAADAGDVTEAATQAATLRATLAGMGWE